MFRSLVFMYTHHNDINIHFTFNSNFHIDICTLIIYKNRI